MYQRSIIINALSQSGRSLPQQLDAPEDDQLSMAVLYLKNCCIEGLQYKISNIRDLPFKAK